MSQNFAIVVSEDIKNNVSQQERDFLRLPENADRWRECLLTIISTVSDKIAALDQDIDSLRKAYSDFVLDPAESLEDQKKKSERFRFYAEKRLAEVDRLMSLGKPSDPSLSLATFLREAIKAHKEWSDSNDVPYSDADVSLYAALEGEWGF